MVIYKIEPSPGPFAGQWIVTAILGNYLEWEVGRYSEKGKAQERVLRMEAMRKAEASTTRAPPVQSTLVRLVQRAIRLHQLKRFVHDC